jgi:CspA family cold shock protein
MVSMGDKNFRDPRHRGFYDDSRLTNGMAPADFTPALSDPPDETPPVRASVKWFNPEKGFGFVELSDQSGDAFLHANVVQRSGQAKSELKPQTILQVRVGAGRKGPQVTEITAIEGGESIGSGIPAHDTHTSGEPLATSDRIAGTVKWYSPERGFGFVTLDGSGRDVFMHASALQRSGLTNLAGRQRVTIEVTEDRKGPKVLTVSLFGVAD